MSLILDEILEHIFSYITNNPDRNAASLVCKSWYKADKHTRHRVVIGNCYALSPGRLIGRFPAVRSLTMKGQPRVADLNWAGYVHPWVVVLARNCPHLQELRLKRMVVLDQTLVLISTAFPNFKSLVLISCFGFTAEGLGVIAANCRFLEHLDLPGSKAGNDNGHWLSCFPKSFTSLVSLNFSCLRGAVNSVDLERLVARCPNLRNLRLSKLVTISTLSKLAILAPQLVEFGIGPQGSGPPVAPPYQMVGLGSHGFGPHVGPQPAALGNDPQHVGLIQHRQSYATLIEALRNWKLICSLNLSGLQVTLFRLLPMSSICAKLISLDMSSLRQGYYPWFGNIIKHCRKLQHLWIVESIGDDGLLVVASTCKDLRDLRLFQCPPLGINEGVTEKGLAAISKGCPLLSSVHFFCHQMTNTALITLSQNCPNITSFGLCFPESKKPDHVTFQPLDEGFGAILQSCKELRWLSLSGLLTDQVFLYIGMYGGQLEVLSATNAGDSDMGMIYVLNGCRNLRKLEVTGCPFGNAALLANIERYITMRCLYMSGCEVTMGGCKVLAKEVPLLNVEVINEQNEAGDCSDDSLKVKKLYVYRTLDGPRDDAPEHVWSL